MSSSPEVLGEEVKQKVQAAKDVLSNYKDSLPNAVRVFGKMIQDSVMKGGIPSDGQIRSAFSGLSETDIILVLTAFEALKKMRDQILNKRQKA
jgi:hypothetical protein